MKYLFVLFLCFITTAVFASELVVNYTDTGTKAKVLKNVVKGIDYRSNYQGKNFWVTNAAPLRRTENFIEVGNIIYDIYQ